MTGAAGVVPQARGLLRLDALYEVMLAALLTAAAAVRPEAGFALPRVLTAPVLLAGAGLLLLAGAAIEALRRQGPRRGPVLALAAANGVTAGALLAWAVADRGFGVGAALVAGLTAADLALLAAFQARAALVTRPAAGTVNRR